MEPKHWHIVQIGLVAIVLLSLLFGVARYWSNVTLPTVSIVQSVLPAYAEDPTHTQMQVLSWKPRVFLYKKFLSHDECDKIISIGKAKLERSKVVEDANNGVSDERTSSGAWIPRSDSKFIDERIAAVTHYPIDHGEDLYLLNYQKTQQYKSHFDWFGSDTKENSEALQDGERVATMIIYLSQVEKGGETWFSKIDLKVKPAKGDALLFYDVLPDNSVDHLSEHAGRPVIKGEKWIATRWIRDRQFYFPEN
jgi:prolyl 4-hydroxylase